AGEVIGAGATPETQGGVHGGGARLVQVPRVRCREEEVLYGVGRRPHTGGQGPPGSLDAQRGRVLVVGGDGPGTPAPATAQHARDGGALQAPERQIGPPGGNTGGHRPIIPEV